MTTRLDIGRPETAHAIRTKLGRQSERAPDIAAPQPSGRFGWGAILFTALVSALATLAIYTGFTR